MIFFSPAKINLFFKILKKREDGFHEISSLYQAVNLFDILHIKQADEDLLTCSDKSIACDSSNLIFKAIELFRKKTSLKFHIHVHLEKNIPIFSGLGGGSSNAATILFALNKLFKRNVLEETLRNWSSEIGSDIAFFFSTGSAYCTGRGEIIKSLPPLKKFPPSFIAKPSFGLSTKEVYQKVDLSKLEKKDPEKMLCSFQKEGDYSNDLEIFAFEINPSLLKIKKNLLDIGFKQVFMTGSGSALVCIGDIKNPILKDVKFYPIVNIQRKKEAWYE
jgi:4-diphosphocytidyl-2-C-methyl-D-erythritol kinase